MFYSKRMSLPNHAMYDQVLREMEDASNVSRAVLARVLVRVMISAPRDIARADIAKGTMLRRPSPLNQSAVSKAVKCLVERGLITEDGARPDEERAGRPIKPLRLGSNSWALMGIAVVHQNDRPVKLVGVVTDMRVDKDLDPLAQLETPLPEGVTFQTVAGHIKTLHDDLLKQLVKPRELFGVGVELASHVHEGSVIGATHVGLSNEDSFDLLTPLQELLTVPVVIDNDVNVLAVRQTYRPLAEQHVSVVAVLNDGVGASLIIDGHVYRGGGGMAAEPGHHTVVNLPPPEGASSAEDGRRFSDPCHCGRDCHVDCYAVPTRLRTELGIPLAEAGRLPALDAKGRLTRAASIFRAGGEALGQGIASIINVVNPARVLLILPGDLAMADTETRHVADTQKVPEVAGRVQPDTAAAQYLAGVEAAVSDFSFSKGAADARAGESRLQVQVMDPSQAEQQGAVCAAIRVLDAFVMHAHERDRCHDLAPDGTTPLVVAAIGNA